MEKNKAIIEGILFAKGEPVSIEDLSVVLEIPVEEVKKICDEMADEYVSESRGLRLITLDDQVQLVTDKSIYEALIKYVAVPKKYVLTDVMLETLAIVAYKQPVTRIEIENIRGVNSDHAVNKLLEYNLIEECGHRKAPGRPKTFRTTDEFLRRFGLSSVDDIPGVDPEIMEYIRQAVAEETGFYDEDGVQVELDLDDPTKGEIRDENDKEAASIQATSSDEVIEVGI